jgi:RNA methyltransferase, TrmH family
MDQPLHVTSRDNPLLVKLRRLLRDGASYRKAGEVWLEGDHLCRAAVQRGRRVAQAVLDEPAWQDAELRRLAQVAARVVLLPQALFRELSTLESPAHIGFLMPLDAAPAIDPAAPSMVLDRLQDAGNVGSMLRSAAALGVAQVLALKGTVALWSPKVLRAGMGAHFGLRLIEGLALADLDRLAVPLVGTRSHGGVALPGAELPRPCAWVFGNEGQGIEAALLERCVLAVRIPQPGGEESLNAAAAAAICLYESQRRRPDLKESPGRPKTPCSPSGGRTPQGGGLGGIQ